jgi:ribosomal protein L37AE/L43A
MWTNLQTGKTYKTARELVYALHRKAKTEERQHYCTQCKETTDHLYVKSSSLFQCLECGAYYFE